MGIDERGSGSDMMLTSPENAFSTSAHYVCFRVWLAGHGFAAVRGAAPRDLDPQQMRAAGNF